MTSNSKIGLILAVFALSGLTASAASATPVFTAASGKAQHLIAEDTGIQDRVTINGSELLCSEASGTAELPAGSSNSLAVTPDYTGCKTEGATFKNLTVTHNGCTFTLTATGPVHIDCPIGKVIEIHHYASTANHAGGSSSCTTTSGPQTAEGNVTYTNLGSGAIEIKGAPATTAQMHGACTFGITVNAALTYHLSNALVSTSGEAVHVK